MVSVAISCFESAMCSSSIELRLEERSRFRIITECAQRMPLFNKSSTLEFVIHQTKIGKNLLRTIQCSHPTFLPLIRWLPFSHVVGGGVCRPGKRPADQRCFFGAVQEHARKMTFGAWTIILTERDPGTSSLTTTTTKAALQSQLPHWEHCQSDRSHLHKWQTVKFRFLH